MGTDITKCTCSDLSHMASVVAVESHYGIAPQVDRADGSGTFLHAPILMTIVIRKACVVHLLSEPPI